MSAVRRSLRQFTFGTGKTAGRNASGRITSFHRGGGAKRLQRTIDLKRNFASSMGVIERIEYDPNRSSRIALVRWLSGIHPPRRTATAVAEAYAATLRRRKVLYVEPSIANTRGAIALKSMLPPVGTKAREVLFSAFSPKGKGRAAAECKSGFESHSIGLPRVAAAAKPSFFATREKGEEVMKVRNWKRNSDVWENRNKRKAAISWHSIAR